MEPPVPVRTVAPKYPADMRRDGTSGVVTVSCLIDEKGNVQEPKVEKASNDAFSQPALDAVRKWKFKPAKKAGEAIALRVSIPIQFNVSESDD
ncbi:MAG TPA: energy transducer TonB [Candidatus Didemnitutus sp.]|nr:energy transducer TonB [Candidatus Didemnitutus sp.]